MGLGLHGVTDILIVKLGVLIFSWILAMLT